MKAIKRRRLTVKNISQITKAMNLVATSKLQRARNALADVADPVLATFNITYNTISHPDVADHPLINSDVAGNRAAYIVITGNRGLCGGYNSNVCKEVIRHIKDHDKTPTIITIGTKGRDYLKRRGYNITDYTPEGELDPQHIVDTAVALYTSGQVDAVYIVYTKFVTVLNLTPITRKILPLDPSYLRTVLADNLQAGEAWEDLGFFPMPEMAEGSGAEVEFEPDLPTVLENVIPWYFTMFVHGAYISANLCEHAARMTSMDSSTKNAGEIIEKLTLQFNRQRQSIITQEITEIVSGANALE